MIDRDPASTRTDREDVLHLLADTIEMTHDRIADYEDNSPDDEERLIKWIRAFGYLTGQYRKLLKDEDLDVLEEKVDLIEMAEIAKEDRP